MVEKVIKAEGLEEVLDLLHQHRAEAKLIAGGTDIIIQLRNGKIKPKVLIDISGIQELRYIKEKDGLIEIGAGTTFRDLEESFDIKKKLTGLWKAAKMVGSPQIRATATVGGNICNGSPAADMVPPLLSLEAIATIQGLEKIREVSLKDLFVGKGKVALEPDEIMTSVRFNTLEEGCGFSFSKLGLRKALAISRICTAVMVQLGEDGMVENIRISNGSLGEYGLREKTVEEFYLQKRITEQTMAEGLNILRNSIHERLHGRSSLPYKIEAIEGTFMEAMKDAVAMAQRERLCACSN